MLLVLHLLPQTLAARARSPARTMARRRHCAGAPASRHGRGRLRGADTAVDHHFVVLSRARRARGRRHQRGQRDPGRFPRLRHPRRDRRARRRRARSSTRCCARFARATCDHREAAYRRGLAIRLLLRIATRVRCCRSPRWSRRYLFLRGHNLPGGGFVAGLVTGGRASRPAHRRAAAGRISTGATSAIAWIAGGLLVAGATGVGSFVFGSPFLTSTFAHPVLPIIGEIPLASAALFDLGVFLVVVAATMLADALADIAAGGLLAGRAGAPDRVRLCARPSAYSPPAASSCCCGAHFRRAGPCAALLRGQPVIFAMGRADLRRAGHPGQAWPPRYADPLPQALVLTAIVISFAMTALLLALALKSRFVNRRRSPAMPIDETRSRSRAMTPLADHSGRSGPAAAARRRAAPARRTVRPAWQAPVSLVDDAGARRARGNVRRHGRRRIRRVYLLGNWPAPFGIVLVLDRLAALMLALTAVIALASLVAAWRLGRARPALPRVLPAPIDGPERRVSHRRPLQSLRVLRGAADRVLRAAAACGGGPHAARGIHYVVINLVGSSLFLIGLGLLYGVTGTLNFADLR